MAGEIPPGVILAEEPKPAQTQPTPEAPANPQSAAPAPPPQPTPAQAQPSAPAPQPQPTSAQAQPSAPAPPPQPEVPADMRNLYKDLPKSRRAPEPAPAPQQIEPQQSETPQVELPEELRSLISPQTPETPATPEPAPTAPATEQPPKPETKYADDESRRIASFLQSGGTWKEVQAYQQAQTLKDASDEEVVLADLRTQFPGYADDQLKGFLAKQIGNFAPTTTKGEDGKEVPVPADPTAKMQLATRARALREQLNATVQKIQSADAPTAESNDATARSEAPVPPTAPQPGKAAIDQEVAARVARKALEGVDFTFPLESGGLTSSYQLSLDPKQQQQLESSVAEYFRIMVDRSGGLTDANAPQIFNNLRSHAMNMAVAMNPDQIIRDAYASGINAARQEAAQRYAGPPVKPVSSSNIPSGGQPMDAAQYREQRAKAQLAGLTSKK